MIANSVLKKAAAKCGGDYSSLQLLGGLTESTYEIKINKEQFVIKFFPASQTSKALIKGQLAWINYLAENGINLAEPVVAFTDNPITKVKKNNSIYYYVIFEKVTGSFIDQQDWPEDLIYKWGQVMGKMHRLAKEYPGPDNGRIKGWQEKEILTEPPRSAADPVLNKWNQYLEKLNNLSTSKDCYGVIHNDLHHQNIYFNQGEPQLLDFGAIEYSWFTYDIAIALYHAVQDFSSTKEDKLKFAAKFIKNFIPGYRSENSLTDEQLTKIDFFLNYRQLYSYLYILKYVAEENIDEEIKEMLNKMKYKIKNDISYIQDFTVKVVV